MTNFFIDGVNFKPDGTVPKIGDSDIATYGLTPRAAGLERYNTLVGLELQPPISILENLKFTLLYTDPSNKKLSDLCGTAGLTITSPVNSFEIE